MDRSFVALQQTSITIILTIVTAISFSVAHLKPRPIATHGTDRRTHDRYIDTTPSVKTELNVFAVAW